MFISYNCQDLNDDKKRADVFQFIKEGYAYIYCWQYAHLVYSMQKHQKSLLNADCYFSFSKSNARGAAIRLKRNLNVLVHQKLIVSEGNHVVLDITVNFKRFTLIIIYGPYSDKPVIIYENNFRIY
jgi:hypothetical protein